VAAGVVDLDGLAGGGVPDGDTGCRLTELPAAVRFDPVGAAG